MSRTAWSAVALLLCAHAPAQQPVGLFQQPPAAPAAMMPGLDPCPLPTAPTVPQPILAAGPGSATVTLLGHETEPDRPNYVKGDWTFTQIGGATIRSTDGILAGPRFSNAYYFRDNLALIAEIGVYWGRVYQDKIGFPDETTGGFSMDAGFRYHWLKSDKWSLFSEALIGYSVLSKSLPANGTNFNFVLQGGGGISRELSDRVRLVAGGRYFHMSNGSFFRTPNPGYDSLYVYGGVGFSY